MSNLKSKNFVIFNTNETDNKIFEDFKKSDKSMQKYFIEICLKALSEEFEVKPRVDAHRDYEKAQFRIEETLHNMLKQKAYDCNWTMEGMLKETALRMIKDKSEDYEPTTEPNFNSEDIPF